MSFAAQIGGFSAKAQNNLQRVRRAIILKLFSAVILDTPVLTGRLRGNWRISSGLPDLSVTDQVDPSGSATIGAVSAEVAKSKGEVPIFLANSLPYAARIEFDGYSSKAPEGMVRKNVVRFNNLVVQANRE